MDESAAVAAAAAAGPAPTTTPATAVVNFVSNYEEIGIPGKNSLREILTESFDKNNYEQEIPVFQFHNGIILPSLRPILPLLYLLGLRSLEFHQSVMEELREKLINRIEEISTKMEPVARDVKLKELLAKSFPLIKIPMLQPVVMALLKNIDVVEDKYLRMLVGDDALYRKCDISVKRYIWQEHPSLLVNELSPLLVQYVKEKEQVFANLKDVRQTFFLLTPKQRRQNEVLQTLANMVGKNVLLYDTILQFLRTVFLHTKNYHYCTLRVSLLMELHDANITDITSMDACHKFNWCLDACLRENTVDMKRVRELQAFLDNIKKGQEQMVSDLAMSLADPYAVNFLVQMVMRILNTQIVNEKYPRDHNTLQFLLRLLNLGLHAYELLKKPSSREPKLNPDLLTRFLPIVMGLMVDDQVRALNAKLPPDDRESALTIIEHSGLLPDIFQTFIQQDPIAAVIAVYYTAQAARQRNKEAVKRVLSTLTQTYDNLTYSDQCLHNLVSGLCQMAEEFTNEELSSMVIDELFYPALNLTNTILHFLKLIHHIHPYLPPDKLENLMANLQQFVQHPESKPLVQQTFVELGEHIEKLKEEKMAAATAGTTAPQQQSVSSLSNTPSLPSDSSGAMSTRHPMMTPGASTPSYMMNPSSVVGSQMSPYYHHGTLSSSGMPPMSPYVGISGPTSPMPSSSSSSSNRSDITSTGYHSSTY